MAKSSGIKINSVLVSFFLFIESFIFPLIYCYFTLVYMKLLYADRIKISVSLDKLIKGGYVTGDLVNIAIGLRYNLFIVFNILIVWGLLIRKNLYRKPENLSDIFYPFIGTFFYLFYNILRYLPQKWNFTLVPARWFFLCALSGFIIANLGLIVSTIATFNLRNSFAIFIQVRQVITQGLFKYVRHPIYSGYIISVLGICLAIPRLYYFILSLFFVFVTIKRARLEEKKIASVSDEYRLYMKDTPFLFPLRIKKVFGKSDSKS